MIPSESTTIVIPESNECSPSGACTQAPSASLTNAESPISKGVSLSLDTSVPSAKTPVANFSFLISGAVMWNGNYFWW